MTDSDPRYDAAERGRRRHEHRLASEGAAQEAARVPHPEPVVRCRDVAGPHEMSPGALRLAQAAGRCGWEGRATYAMGTEMHANGKPGGLIESVAVRLRRGRERAVAVWQRAVAGDERGQWRPDVGFHWVDGVSTPVSVGVSGVAKVVKTDSMSGAVSGAALAVTSEIKEPK